MTAVRRQGSIARSAALIVLAALAVHQLRYLLAYGSGAHEQLARAGPRLPAPRAADPDRLRGLRAGGGPAQSGAALGPRAPADRRVADRASSLYAVAIVSVFAVQETRGGPAVRRPRLRVRRSLRRRRLAGAAACGALRALCAALDGGLARLESLVARVARTSPRRSARATPSGGYRLAGRDPARVAAARLRPRPPPAAAGSPEPRAAVTRGGVLARRNDPALRLRAKE